MIESSSDVVSVIEWESFIEMTEAVIRYPNGEPDGEEVQCKMITLYLKYSVITSVGDYP